MKSLIILFLALACVSGQFFNPFRAFGRRPRPPPPRPAPFNPRPAAAPAQSSSGGSSPSCTNGFHVSSSRSFSWSAARNYCTSRGLKPSSLENAQKVWKKNIFIFLTKVHIHFLFFRSALQRIWSVPCHISGLAVKNQALILLSIGLMVPDLYLNGQILAGK